MGDAADDMINREIDRQLYPFGVDILFHDAVREQNRALLAGMDWTQRNGKAIKFKDMQLSHLLNVVRMQERTNNKHAAHLRDYYEYRVTMERVDP